MTKALTCFFDQVLAGDGTNSRRQLDGLSIAALAYLGLPALIFLATWLRPPYALAALMLTAAAVWSSLPRHRVVWCIPYSGKVLALVAATGIAWAAMGGGSHFVYANPDWLVRDAILGDLTWSEWPPSYGVRDGAHYVLRTALGFFLPIAAVGKLVGTGWLAPLVFVWTAMGTVLFLLLLPLPTRASGRLMLALTIVILFSGMDILGMVILQGELPLFPLRLEWWTNFSYPSLSGQLLWAPNHALALWMVAALFYRHWKHADFIPYLCLLLPVIPLVSPFALPGITPFLLLLVFDRVRSGDGLGRLPPIAIVFGLLIGGLILRLLTLDIDSIPAHHVLHAGITVAVEGANSVLGNYLIFILAEFGILGLVLYPLLRHSRGIAAMSIAVLVLLPFAYFGPSNDLMLRVSTPPLVFLAILCVRILTDEAQPLILRHKLLVVILLIGAYTPFIEFWRSATWRRVPADYTRSFLDTQKGGPPAHYVGRLNQPWLITLLREPLPVPTQQERKRQSKVSP